MSLLLRPASPSDLPAIYELNRKIEIGDKIPIVTPLEEFADWIDDPHFSFDDDIRLAEVDGRLVGYGNVWYRPSDSSQSRAFMLGGVDPAYRRGGIGTCLLSWQMERSKERVLSGPADMPRFIRTMAYDFETEAIALYERHGLSAVRYYDALLRPLVEVDEIPVIDGIDLVPWDDSRREELRVLNNVGFADHWGSTPIDPKAWNHRIDSFGVRADLSWMAVEGDRIVSMALNYHFTGDQEVTGRLDGWVMSLATDPAYRRRGIASALVLASCRSFADAGFSHAALGVDSENPTGAYRIYQRLGFQPMHRSVAHQLEV